METQNKKLKEGTGKIKVVFFDDAAKRGTNDPDDDEIQDYVTHGMRTKEYLEKQAVQKIFDKMRERNQA